MNGELNEDELGGPEQDVDEQNPGATTTGDLTGETGQDEDNEAGDDELADAKTPASDVDEDDPDKAQRLTGEDEVFEPDSSNE